jgi:hypothetical protein
MKSKQSDLSAKKPALPEPQAGTGFVIVFEERGVRHNLTRPVRNRQGA